MTIPPIVGYIIGRGFFFFPINFTFECTTISLCRRDVYRILMTGVLQGYTLQKEADTCCGRCIPTACIMQRPDGKMISLEVGIL